MIKFFYDTLGLSLAILSSIASSLAQVWFPVLAWKTTSELTRQK